MRARSLSVALGLLLVACSGGKNRDTNRDLGNAGRDARADAEEGEEDPGDEQDARAESDAALGEDNDASSGEPSDAAVDASAMDASTDAGLDAGNVSDGGALDGAAQPDAAEASVTPDAGNDADVPPPDGSYIRVSVDNPRGHENPIAFAWGSPSIGPDPNGFVRGFSEVAALEVTLGESDETLVARFLDVRSGDHLHFLYRHFREIQQFRDVMLPSGPLPQGTQSVQAGDANLSQGQTMGSTRFYFVGTSDYLAEAISAFTPDLPRVVGYAFVKNVAPATTPVTLGPWLTPRQVPVSVVNAPTDATIRLIARTSNDQSFQAALAAEGQSFVVPPNFADRLEARVIAVSADQEKVVSQLIARCGPDSTASFALDFAEALPGAAASATSADGMTTWTFPDPGPGLRGDALFFDGILMPATQTTLTMPNSEVSGTHYLLRIDLGSSADYQAFKQAMLFDLDLINRLSNGTTDGALNVLQLCPGTDTVRATLVQLNVQT